jgi:alanine dehydrogenase
MQIGVPREVKDGERRVGLTPDAVRALVEDGHRVSVERGAGDGSGFGDEEYAQAGASLEPQTAAVWQCDLVVKIKELQAQELPLLRPGTTVLGFAQLNRDPELLRHVLAARVRVLAYEAIRDPSGALPCLAPMSRIAGRLAPLVGAMALTRAHGGAGLLLTGIGDVPAGRVVVLGAGNVGREAARVAARLGCSVLVLSRGAKRLAELADDLAASGTPIATRRFSSPDDGELAAAIRTADLVVGAVMVEPGVLSPKLLTRSLVRSMRPGSAIVDVGIDHGGIAETSRMTKLSEPTYVDERIVHYAVPNMPSLVPRTATFALVRSTLPYVRVVARDLSQALLGDPGLAAAAMTWDGAVVHAGLARDAVRPHAPLHDLLRSSDNYPSSTSNSA